jgi:hypothetical protein
VDIVKIDTWLGAIQKTVVVIGVLVSAWIFILKEEASPHVNLISSSEILNHCVLRIDVQAENTGGRVWQIDNAIARVFKPDFSRIQSSENLKALEIGTQILSVNQSLRVGESASFGFNIRLPVDKNYTLIIVKVAMNIKEDGGEWIRIVEEAVPVEKCE